MILNRNNLRQMILNEIKSLLKEEKNDEGKDIITLKDMKMQDAYNPDEVAIIRHRDNTWIPVNLDSRVKPDPQTGKPSATDHIIKRMKNGPFKDQQGNEVTGQVLEWEKYEGSDGHEETVIILKLDWLSKKPN